VEQRSEAHAALGRAIRELRAERAVSQEELASSIGMHRTYLGGIERGERNPSFTNITRIAASLDIQPSDLLARGEKLLSG